MIRLYYLRHFSRTAASGKTRLILTSAGVFVAVLLFAAGTIFSESYYAGYFRIAEEMDPLSAVIRASVPPEDVRRTVSEFCGQAPCEVLVNPNIRRIFSADLGEGQRLNVMATIVGVSDMGRVTCVPSDAGPLALKTVLVSGRLLTASDVVSRSRIVVIDELTANILFDEGEAVGASLRFGDLSSPEDPPVSFEVVGVVRSPYSSYTREMTLRRELASKNQQYLILPVTLYCPISAAQIITPEEDAQFFTAYAFDDAESYGSFYASLETLIRLSAGRGEQYEAITRDSETARITSMLVYTKSLLGIVSVTLAFICAVSVMSVTFFALKERIPEIGVRKAFGAAKPDIVFQFVFETVPASFLTSVFAVCCAFYSAKFLEGYLSSKLYMPFTVAVKPAHLALPVLAGVLEAAVCSVIPGLYAARVKVTDALRFE